MYIQFWTYELEHFKSGIKNASCVYPGETNQPCKGFHEVLSCYKEVVQRITMSGPTNFVPIITKSIEIVKMTGQYHILVIIADGQVSDKHDQVSVIIDN